MRQGRHLLIAIGGDRFAADAGRVVAVAEPACPTPLPLAPPPAAGLRVEGLGRFAGGPLLQVAPVGVRPLGGRLLVYDGAGGPVGVRVDRVEALTDEGAAVDLPPFDPDILVAGLHPGAVPSDRRTEFAGAAERPRTDVVVLLLAMSDGQVVGLPVADVGCVAEVGRVYDRPGDGTLVALIDGRLRPARSLAQRLRRTSRTEPWAIIFAGTGDVPALLVERVIGLRTMPAAEICPTNSPTGDVRLWWADPSGILVEIFTARPLAGGRAVASLPVRVDPPRAGLFLTCGRHRLLASLETVRGVVQPGDLPPPAGRGALRDASAVPVLDLRRLLDGGTEAGKARRAVVLGAGDGGAALLVLVDDAALGLLPASGVHPIPHAPPVVAALFDGVSANPLTDPADGGWVFRLRAGAVFAALAYPLRRRVARALAGWLPCDAIAGVEQPASAPPPVEARVCEPA